MQMAIQKMKVLRPRAKNHLKVPSFEGGKRPLRGPDPAGPKGPLPHPDTHKRWWEQFPHAVKDHVKRNGICQLSEFLDSKMSLRDIIAEDFTLGMIERDLREAKGGRRPTTVLSVLPERTKSYPEFVRTLSYGNARYIPRSQWGLKGAHRYRDVNGPYRVGNTNDALRFQHNAAIARDTLRSTLWFHESTGQKPSSRTLHQCSDLLYGLRPDQGGHKYGAGWLKTLHYRTRCLRRLSRVNADLPSCLRQ